MVVGKKLSNPFSTGGGGSHFEAHVQSSYVALMLTGGYAPYLPCWPIVEVNLQGKIDGYETDDIIVTVQNINNNSQRKLLGQIKHSINITKSSDKFGEVIQAAWNDYNNQKLFNKNKDIIVLITGPLSTTDVRDVQWILGHSRYTKDVDDFLRNVTEVKYSSTTKREKLEVFKHHLKVANNGIEVSDIELYDFMKHFYLLGYDLGYESGVVLSLLHSHFSQFDKQCPKNSWSRIVDMVQAWNKNGGIITPEKIPQDLIENFKSKEVRKIPEDLLITQQSQKTEWAQHPDATFIALILLIGGWDENNENDTDIVSKMLGISYNEWLRKAQEILHQTDSPLTLKNGVWKTVNRVEFLNQIGTRILDQNLETFKFLLISVLNKPDPSFDLPTEKRYAASIHGKVLDHSHVLRQGMSEGLAILGCYPDKFCNCSQGKNEAICVFVLRELLTDANWIVWGSLNNLLPTLSEAAPSEFLTTVENAFRLTPCPYDELFAQEGGGITGSNYLTGLLWALEGLAWDEQYLVRVCVILGELANHDTGGNSANRPSNTLATILLPWLPQTLASVDKRQVVVNTLLKEWPDIAWNLVIQLLPGFHQTSSETHRPIWRNVIPDDWKKGVTHQEYWRQASFLAETAVITASYDVNRLSILIDKFANLPAPTFGKLIDILGSQTICDYPEEQRQLLWDQLIKFINKHRRFPEAKWTLPDNLIKRIEKVSEKLAPKDPFNLYQYLFTDREYELSDEKGDWKEQQNRIKAKRDAAISEIYLKYGIDGVVKFSKYVVSTVKVGNALGSIVDDEIEKSLLPGYLDSNDKKLKAFISSFIWRLFCDKGWRWFDNLDISGWNPEQIGKLLSYLPFTKDVWQRVSELLSDHEEEYWIRTDANVYPIDDDYAYAIDKLLENGRPHAAIKCLDMMLHDKIPFDVNQCTRALIAGLSSNEPSYVVDRYHIIELIKHLQSNPSTNDDDLFKIEWVYLRLLNRHSGAFPQLLENKLANDPDFFCEVIQLVYKSKKKEHELKELTKETEVIAENAWHLLFEWKTPPGTKKNNEFNAKCFVSWLERVKETCVRTGHLEVSLINIGNVLVHAPVDPNGLWIHTEIATALNDREHEYMRRGFRTGINNLRGAYWVDPTAKPEKDLAKQFQTKADEVENAGFQRFAVTLRGLADSYAKEADYIIMEHEKESNE